MAHALQQVRRKTPRNQRRVGYGLYLAGSFFAGSALMWTVPCAARQPVEAYVDHRILATAILAGAVGMIVSGFRMRREMRHSRAVRAIDAAVMSRA